MSYSNETHYKGRVIRYQPFEKVWVFNIRNEEGKLERRVRNTLRAAKQLIDQGNQI